ncbi:DUF6745 domain-containing protein [Mycolicibacterium conceptionense]|uniref:DUF6745 domain-containing protein n=1 Tax=Mycolicibacterium conceptionense TaxID=451644 RepID=UPI003204CC28
MAAEIVSGDLGVNEIQSEYVEPVDPRRIIATLRETGVVIGADRTKLTRKKRVTDDIVENARAVNPFDFTPWDRYLTGLSAVDWLHTHAHITHNFSRLADLNLVWDADRWRVWAFAALLDQPVDTRVLSLAALAAVGIEPVDATGLLQVARQVSWWCGFADVAILAERPSAVHATAGVRTAVYRDGFTATSEPPSRAHALPPQNSEPLPNRPIGGLKNLNEARKSALTDFIRGWHADTTSTDPVDRHAAEAGIRLMYQAEGLEPPKSVLWFDSPLAGALAQSMMWMHGHKVHTSWPRSRTNSDEEIRNRCYKHFPSKVESWLHETEEVRRLWEAQVDLNQAVIDALHTNIHREHWHHVAETWPDIWATATRKVHAHLGLAGSSITSSMDVHTASWSYGGASAAHLTDYLWDPFRGRSCSEQSAIWLAALLSSLEVPVSAMRGRIQATRNTSWWWPMNDLVIATERPVQICTDEQGRLHSPDGPAITYRDGFRVYCWHGDAVPADLIETDWDVPRLLTEWGVTQWCAVEKIGWDTVLKELGTQPRASAPDPQHPGQLLHLYDVPTELRIPAIRSRCRIVVSTQGFHLPDGQQRRWLKVPATSTDPIAAVTRNDLRDPPRSTGSATRIQRAWNAAGITDNYERPR